MALAGVGSAVNFIGNMVVEEAKYLCEVEEKVEELKDELEWMTCFLQDVDARRDHDARMRRWIRQISWLAYQSEDIIASFIVKVELQRRGGLMKKVKRCSCIMREAKARHELGSDIDALKLKISTLTSRLQTYGIKTIKQGSSSSVGREERERSYAHHVQEGTVGLESDVEVVVNHLKAVGKSKIVALCGSGGLGKTTLAKIVYHHRDVRRYFDAFAWASVSHQCHAESVLTELLRCLTSEKESNDQTKEDPKKMENANNHKTVEDLMSTLYSELQKKKCLVVLDAIWSNDAWNSLKDAFPIDRNEKSEWKLMLTTRNESVATYADSEAVIHKQRILNDRNAWKLLVKKLPCDPSNIFGKQKGHEAEKLAKKMLKHCKGLPLAIAALGGILARKKSLEEWKTAHENIKTLLENAKEGNVTWKEALGLSYYDLPFYLKPCFLYLGIFPEDTKIYATKLIHLWMAEGFLSTNNSNNDDDDDVEQQGSLEEVGQAYLVELVERSMVQVGSTRGNGRIKWCYLHGLMRELCISKAAEENFLKVSIVKDDIAPPVFTLNRRKRYRRLAIHRKVNLQKRNASACCDPNNKKVNVPVHVKSLLFYEDMFCATIAAATGSSILRTIVKQFRLLRVLDLVGIKMKALPKEVGDLVHLRFLSIRGSLIKVVPSSMVKLKSLQTLDLRSIYMFVIWFPDMIQRMRQLRHVYMPYHVGVSSIVGRIAYKLGSYKLHKNEGGYNNNLEVLCNFRELHRLKDLAKLTNLRKLSVIQYVKKEDFEHIKDLQSLSCDCLKHLSFQLTGDVLIDKPDALQCFSGLNKLKLKICDSISLSSSSSGSNLGHNILPDSLTTLYLLHTKIGNTDAMQILEKLPNLKKLELLLDSYRGKDMTCSHGGFAKLTSLRLFGLKYLKEWTIERGAMPSLLRLYIDHCTKFKTFPDGIKSIPSLQFLNIQSMPKDFCDKVREWKKTAIEGGEDAKGVASEVEEGLANSYMDINHIPTINILLELEN